MTPAGSSPGGNGFGLAFEDAEDSLDRLVRPHGWQNPQPRGLYDLVVIGGGTAGLVSAVGAAGLGARVALVERQRLGVVGCTIVSSRAGDLIGLAGNLIGRRASMAELSPTIFPYPTQAEAYRKAGDAYRRTRLTPRVRRTFERYFALARW
jgi:glycine/D-amino acid oxidase-like deaminating enzyme